MTRDKIRVRVRELIARAEDPSLSPADADVLLGQAAELVAKFGWRYRLEVGEKQCMNCGRIGTRDFVNNPDGPSWMGPWRCRWDGPCGRRRQAVAKALVDTEDTPKVEDPPVIDLDELQAGEDEKDMDVPSKGTWGAECLTPGCSKTARWIALGDAPTPENPYLRYRCEDCCNVINDIWTRRPTDDELRAALAADVTELRVMASRAKGN